MIRVELDDAAWRDAMRELVSKTQQLRPLYKAIGDVLEESTKQRFVDSKAPDGSAWKPNAQSTIDAYLGKFKGNYRKDGRLNKKGAARAAGKKPLIGESRDLSTRINYAADTAGVTLGSPLVYAATHQFGRGNIPARPFLGVSSADEGAIRDAILDYLDIL